MPSCVACGKELEPPVRVLHTVYVKRPVPHRRPGLLPPPHHQGRGGRQGRRRDQTRRRPDGGHIGLAVPARFPLFGLCPADM